MSTLVLVRHGQSRQFKDGGTGLTDLGRQQAEALARHWVERDVRVDEVRTGTLDRQVESERCVQRIYEQAGKPWPEPVRDEGWNEYDASALSGRLMPALVESDASFRALVEDFEAHRDAPDRNRYFQRMFEVLIDRWVQGSTVTEGLESFADFHARVLQARQRVLDGPSGRAVAVFTSGGPIGVGVQAALDAPPASALAVNWRVKNASLTEFTFSRNRLSLDGFNLTAHLEADGLVTYR
jgi:broad specificity phosphatase PhoE